jgi:cell division protein YceG involved in septum cleavage
LSSKSRAARTSRPAPNTRAAFSYPRSFVQAYDPQGVTSEQVVERLREDPVLIGEIEEIPPDGSLEPDTYYFERGDTRQSLLTRMAAIHARRLQNAPAQ